MMKKLKIINTKNLLFNIILTVKDTYEKIKSLYKY